MEIVILTNKLLYFLAFLMTKCFVMLKLKFSVFSGQSGYTVDLNSTINSSSIHARDAPIYRDLDTYPVLLKFRISVHNLRYSCQNKIGFV